MIKFFISRVLVWAASINWKQFLKVLPIIHEAAARYPKPPDASNAERQTINIKRAVFATAQIVATLNLPEGSKVNLIRELAVVWLKLESK